MPPLPPFAVWSEAKATLGSATASAPATMIPATAAINNVEVTFVHVTTGL